MEASVCRDRSTNIPLIGGGWKFSGDRSHWNEAKTGIMCRLAEEEVVKYVQTSLVDLKLECKGADELAKVGSKAFKAWGIVVKNLTGPALVLAQQKSTGDAY